MTPITRNPADMRRGRLIARYASIALALGLASPCVALELALPRNAALASETVTDPDSYALPIGAYANDQLPVLEVTGRMLRQAWRMDGRGQTTLQIIDSLKTQIAAQGYDILFACAADGCGGFDFRFATEVIPAPEMHVDLFNFRYFAAALVSKSANRADATDYVSVLVSRSNSAGFVQIIRVTSDGSSPLSINTSAPDTRSPPPQSASSKEALPLAQALERDGHVVLDDLTFDSGSAGLGAGPFTSLATLAEFLLGDPARRVALVGHTDATGSLEANIALSKRRARAVADRLVSAYAVAKSQLDAEGMGYLAPRTTNLSDSGRDENRRVEVILLNTQ